MLVRVEMASSTACQALEELPPQETISRIVRTIPETMLKIFGIFINSVLRLRQI